MAHFTTTFDRIVALSEAEQRLLSQESLSDADQRRFRDIRAELAQLWTERRAELVFELHGPPRITGNAQPVDRRRIAAYGIAPLPSGGTHD